MTPSSTPFDVSVSCAVDSATLSLRSSLPPRGPLRPAPTFYPSEAQFADPLAYVQSIRHIGEKTGVCKIVPPPSWRPPMCLNPDTFQFRSKVQRIDMLQQRGQGGQTGAPAPLPLPAAAAAVEDADAAAAAAASAAASNAQTAALSVIAPASSPRKASDSAGGESPHTAQGSPTTPAEADSAAAAAGSAPAAARLTKRASKPPAFFSAEQAREAAAAAAMAAAAAAASAKRKRESSTGAVSTGGGAGKRASAARRKRAKGAGGSGIDPYSNTRCEICQGADHDGKILLCDECDQGFHIFCLSPPLAAIPATDWYCPSCQADKMNAFGFDMGRTFTLTQFKQHADEFLESWFTKERAAGRLPQPPPATAVSATEVPTDGSVAPATAPFVPPTAADICRSFWHIVESSREAVSVDYGSDLDTEYLGSGFPRDGPYADHPFNVNNLAMAKGGIFNWLDDAMLISGVTVPWLYVGMIFSTFCWHVEDHNMMSINYVHQGASKQWYGVPSSSAGKFERKMRQALPNLFNLNPDLLFQLVTMLNPTRIATHGSEDNSGSAGAGAGDSAADDPSLYYLLQNAGEMVITFPRSYHAGFNHGFNIAESSNFAGVEWLPYGAKCIERYRFFRRTPIFNHEELVWRMAEHAVAAFENLCAQMAGGVEQGRANKWKRKYELKDARARSMFSQSTAAAGSAALSGYSNAAPGAGSSKSDLHALAQRNRQLSLATFEQIWYFVAWLLPALQELLSRETQGRAALHTVGTLRGKIWGGEPMLPTANSSSALAGGGGKKGALLAPALPIGSQVSATWQGNPAFNRDAPTDPAQLCWYNGTVIGWTPPTAAAHAAGSTGGLYSVRFHEDGLVDEHVLAHHVRSLGGSSQPGGGSKGPSNEWLTYQACVDGNDGTAGAGTADDANMGASQSEGQSGADGGAAAVAMKRKLKKSAVDFAPEAVSTLVSCAICRHALYLSCVRCSCSPEKASCLLHAQELCACDGGSKTIHFRQTIWQMHNMISAMETVINSRSNAKPTNSDVAKGIDVAGAGSGSASPLSAVTESPTLPPIHYCPLTDMYEQATSADQFPVPASAETVVVRGTDPDNNFNSYPLRFTALMPVFSMGVDEEDAGGNVAAPDASTAASAAVDAEKMSTGDNGEDAAESVLDSDTMALLSSVAPVDWQRPSNRLLQSILSESRRVMSENDDYVAAVGLRDEKLAEAAAATLAEEEMAPRSLEAQLDATAQPNRRFSRSVHQLRLRAAAAAAAPALAVAHSAAKDELVESTKQSLRVAADAWLQRYGWVVARHEEAIKSFDAERTSLDWRRIQRAVASASPPPAVASPDPGLASPPPLLPAIAAAVGATNVSAAVTPTSGPAAPIAMDESSGVKGEPPTAADGSAIPPPAKDEASAADVEMSDATAVTVSEADGAADSALAAPAVKAQPPEVPSASPKPGGEAAILPSSLLSPLPVSPPPARSFAFLTATELEFAIHEGEKFICGDESFLPVCELYGVLLSWQSNSLRLAQRLCALDHLHKNLSNRSRKLGEAFERECAYIAGGRTSASTEVPKNVPADAAQLSVDQAAALIRDVATCPVQIACVCGYGVVAAANKTVGAVPTGADAPLPCATTLAASSFTPATRAALSHLADWTRFLEQARDFLSDPDRILGCGDVNSRAAGLLERAPLYDPGSFQRLMSPLIRQLVAASSLPIKMRQKVRYLQMCRALLEARKESMMATQHRRMGGGSWSHAAATKQQQLPQLQPFVFNNFNMSPFSFGPFGFGAGTTVAAGASVPPILPPMSPSPLLAASFSATHPSQSAAGDGSAALPSPSSASSLPTAAMWLRDVSAILSSATVPPLYQILYQYHLDAKQLFPSVPGLLEFSHRSLDEPAADAVAALPFVFGIDAAQIVMWLRRLNAICWAGFWWLTGCRRLLSRASSSPLAMLTPIPTQHDQPAALLDALPVPPLLAEWAMGNISRRRSAMTGGAQDAPGVSTLPWCPDVLGHAATSIARKSAPSSAAAASDKFPCCCARTLLSADILSICDIPESQVLEYLAQQCTDWTRRARDILPAEAYRSAGVQPPLAAVQAERAVTEVSAREGRTLDSASFRLRCGSGRSIPLLVGVVWESSGIGFAPPEMFILAAHMERCQSWQVAAMRVVESSHRVFVSFYSMAHDAHPTLDTLQAQMREIEETLQQAESLSVWTEEGHALVKLWGQASAIMKRLRVNAVPPQQLQMQQLLAQAQAHMQAAAMFNNPAAAAAAFFGASSAPAFTPSFTPQMLQQLAATSSLFTAPSSSSAAVPSAAASQSLIKAESAAEAEAIAAPPPSSEVLALAPGQRYPMAKNIGEMLTRMAFALNNPLAQAMDRESREIFWGFSSQTLQRYQRHAQRAKEAGIDLAHFALVNYQDIGKLISAAPAEREAILAEAVITGGAHKRVIRNSATSPAFAAAMAAKREHGTGAASEDEGGQSDDSDAGSRSEVRRTSSGRRQRKSTVGAESLIADVTNLDPVARLGLAPVPPVTLLSLPAPTEAQRADITTVYARRSAIPGQDYPERRRLLAFTKSEKLFTPLGLLPFQSLGFGQLHPTRKAKAIRMIQDEFGTCPVWTRKFLASTHGNHRRLLIDRQVAAERIKQRRDTLLASAGPAAAAGAAGLTVPAGSGMPALQSYRSAPPSFAEPNSAPATPRSQAVVNDAQMECKEEFEGDNDSEINE